VTLWGVHHYNTAHMTYQVLARKLRPANFSELVGQDHVVQALTHALDHNRLHHAYLFTGTRGVGKTTVARILAKCLNCEQGVSATPCGECDTCVAIAEGRSVDLIEMDGASHRGVEDVQELQDNAQYMPNSARYKVFLIDEVHMLTTHAFNALLKILEEPPEHVKFLFATTEVKKLPITILSRCLQFQLKNMSIDAIKGHLSGALTNEGVAFDAGALRIIATAAAGSMRDALSVTDQAISYGGGKLDETSVASMLGVTGRNEVLALLDALADREANRLLGCVAELAERGIDFAAVLEELLSAFHAIAVRQQVPDESVDSDDSIGVAYAQRFTPEAVQLHYQIALRSHRDLAFSPDPRIGFEMAMLRMLSFVLAPPSGASPSPDTRAGQNTPAEGAAPKEPSPQAALQDTPTGHTPARPAAAARRPDGLADTNPVSVRMPNLERQEAAQALENQAPTEQQAATTKLPAADTPRDLPLAPDNYWYSLQETLPQQGVVAMLMRNARLISREQRSGAHDNDDVGAEERWHLGLDPAHDALLNKRHPQEMQGLLRAATNRPIVVHLTVEPLAWETPSLQNARELEERREAAIAELRANTDVVALLDTFGGARLDESTIEPIDHQADAGDSESNRMETRGNTTEGDRA